MTGGRFSSFSALLSSGLVPVLSLFLSDEVLKSIPPRPSLLATEVGAVVPKDKLKAFCPRPDVAVFPLWKSEPPRPARAPPKESPVDAAVVVAGVTPKLFNVNPVDAAGVDVRADERVRPLAEVEVTGRANGVADAAGLLNPKLKPVVDADVVAAVPALVPPRVNPVAGLDPKSPVPKPPAEADVDAGAAELPRDPKLSPTEGVLDAPAPKENPLPVPVPPGATVVEPRVPDPKENPVAMAALGAKPSARAERPRMLQSPHCGGGMCHISVASGDGEGNSTPSSAAARSEGAGPHANACATPPAR